MTQLFEGAETSYAIEILLVGCTFLVFAVWLLVDWYRFTRFQGKLKRGVRVWSRDLLPSTWQFLLSMQSDFVQQKRSSSRPERFIRIQGDEILIYSSPEKFHSSWACIGYVEKTSPVPRLEYRMSVPGIIFLFLSTVIGAIIFLLSFNLYRNAIDSFLENHAKHPDHLEYE